MYLYETISYWNFSEEYRAVIDSMETDGFLTFENTLFSESERKYLNYYLNKSEFTNGMDLRNKYAHGTNSQSVEEHTNDYYLLLKILVLILMKIEDDLLIGTHILQSQ